MKFLVEFLPNLWRLQVFVEAAEVDIRVEDDKLILSPCAVLLDLKELRLKVKLIQKSASGATIHLAPLDNSIRTPTIANNMEGLDAPLVVNYITSLKCKGCSRVLLESADAAMKVYPLPSEYWHEFLECWLCHSNEEFTRITGTHLGSKCGRIMDGGSYYLVHSSDLKGEMCHGSCECGNKYGLVSGNYREVKIFKHRINVDYQVEAKEEQRNFETFDMFAAPKKRKLITETKSVSFIECFLFDLYQKTRAHAQFKFHLKSSKEAADGLLIWIFNWDSKLALSSMDDYNAEEKIVEFGNCKALYVLIPDFFRR
jgi:hypothetical protein